MTKQIINGVVIDENAEFSLDELSSACGVSTDWLLTLVEEGILEPELKPELETRQSDPVHWRFHITCMRRVRVVYRLEADLGINLPGAALALELLDEVESLRKRVSLLKNQQ